MFVAPAAISAPRSPSSGTVLSVGHPRFGSTQSTTHNQCSFSAVFVKEIVGGRERPTSELTALMASL